MDISQISLLLKQILEAHSPELGARLKQRLNALLVGQGQQTFDERAFGFRRFADFLEKTQTAILKVDRTAHSTDIVVSLRGALPSATLAQQNVSESDSAAIRSDVWQAFTNANTQRKRFLNKGTFQLKHFIEADQSPPQLEVLGNRDQFIEIQPVPGEVQLEWMREYLRTTPIHAPDRAPLDAMTEQPYSSNLNFAFTRALGKAGDGWRQFRTQRVTEAIGQWASTHEVPLERLRKPAVQPSTDSGRLAATTARTRAQNLLQLISEEDIAKVVIPVLVTTLLIRTGS
ncbi:hypothetical protein [Achromobacter xylosoxidans]|uniref:hypothetical protein n=1 Tax=Alcaligenes xylosoxydans xylosoxydans TaxID=85698 RepID=UPI0013AF5C21|nr:hypothetical protein [Achromobacter xylosoxidans]